MSAQGGMSRRIPDNLGGTDTIFDNAPIVGAVQAMDGIIAFAPSLFTLFLFESFLPPGINFIGFIFSGIIFFCGILALLAKPQYLTLQQWISDIRRFRNEPSTYRKALPNGEGGDDTDESVESIEVNSERDTRTKINLERIYPRFGAIERPDDTVVGIIRVRGLNLDSANQETIARSISQFDNLINQQLREDIQLYMPMQQYDPTRQVDMYEERLEESQVVQNDPLLQEYINDRISFITAMSIGSYIRRFYVVCQVPRKEVVTKEAQASEGKRLFEKALPGSFGELAGNIYVLIKGGDTMMNEEDLKLRQLEELEDKRAQLANMFEGHLGTKTEELDADEVGVLLKEFWEGVHVSEDEKEGFIRRNPYVKGELDRERAENAERTDFEDITAPDDAESTQGDM